MGRTPHLPRESTTRAAHVWVVLVVAAAAFGLVLLLDSIRQSSATYDEVTYLRVAAKWWRTGEQIEITRMGSPLSFWKLQQAPVLWLLDRLGQGSLIDDPIRHQARLLPILRAGAIWIWLATLLLCAWWCRQLYGPRAMALSAWLFALSPNLIAHGGLITMELPLLACITGMLFLFWSFLRSGRQRWLWASAALGGLAFSCKYTVVIIPPIMAVVWWCDALRSGDGTSRGRLARRVVLGMTGYVVVMILANLVITGGAVVPLSASRGEHPSIEARFGSRFAPWVARLYETPVPQDWVGLANQVHRQMAGGPSYLLGQRRLTGWRCYYLVALAVKVPLTFWCLLAGRVALARRHRGDPGLHDEVLPWTIGLFLAIAAAGSTRNYGVRYLLPLAPLAIIWVSRLAEDANAIRGWPVGWPAWIVGLGLAGQGMAVAAVHPFELTYFNVLAGGPMGGRHVLSDSNLDWGQGLKGLARLQRVEPEFRDLTLYYFGDTDPSWYGVEGVAHVVNAVDDHAAPGGAGLSGNAVSGGLGLAPVGAVGTARVLRGARFGPAGSDERRYHHRDLPPGRPGRKCGNRGDRVAVQYRSRPLESRSSTPSARSAILRMTPRGSTALAVSTGRFSTTTKYSSPRSTRMAKWPSVIRALWVRRIRQSRSLAGPQIDTRASKDRPFSSVPAGPT